MTGKRLRELAEKGEALRNEEASEREVARVEGEEARNSARDERLHASFGTGALHAVFAILWILGWLAPVAWVTTRAVPEPWTEAALFGAGLVLLATGGVFGFVGRIIATQRMNRWLRSMPFELDRGAYVGEVAREPQGQERVRVTVRLERAPLPTERSTLESALIGAAGSCAVVFDEETLTIESPPLQTYYVRRENKAISHHRKQHVWFRTLADRGLKVVHETYPIQAITVAFVHPNGPGHAGTEVR